MPLRTKKGKLRREWFAPSPCPDCGRRGSIQIVYYTTPEDKHQHTWYICTNWPHPGSRCEWTGWTIPTWGT